MNKHYFSFHFDSSKKSWAQRMMSLALVVLFAISASVSFAQNESQRTKLVQGTVLDENGEPMRSVTVVPANDTGGTITDTKGVYILKCAETCDSLNFSFIGYKTLTIACKDAQTVRMQLEVLSAEDVVVTGVYTRKKDSYTGAATTLMARDLQRVGNQNLIQSLRSLDPSLRIADNMEFGSDPNKLPEITLRGSSSLAESIDISDFKGNYQKNPNQPLFILDGFETSLERIIDMDMNRIESVTILKDASAKALYGSKAANGVIVVETKRIMSGEQKVTYNGSVTITAPDLSSYNLCNAWEKLEVERLAGLYHGDQNSVDQREEYYEKLRLINDGLYTDWMSKPLQLGVGHKHNISVELGDSKSLRSVLDFTYNNVAGVMKGSDRTNISGSINMSYRHNDVLFRNVMSVTSNKSFNSPWGSFSEYTKLNPYWRATDSEGNLLQFASNSPHVPNPMYDATIGTLSRETYLDFVNNFYVEYRITPSWKVTGRLGISAKRNDSDDFLPANHSTFTKKMYPTDEEKSVAGSYTLETGKNNSFDADVNMQYNISKGKHSLFSNAGVFFSESQSRAYRNKAVGLPSNQSADITFARQYAEGTRPTGMSSIQRSASILLSANYTYDNRYFADATVRYNGSSLTGSDNRWAASYSFGLGWNIHKEKFMENSSAVKEMRLRASLGVTGNEGFNTNEAIATYNYYTSENSMYQGNAGSFLMRLPNPNLKGQQKMDYNVGLDMNLWDKVSLRIDAYDSYTRNMLANVTLPPSAGFTSYKENVGKIRNRGLEANVTVRLINNEEGFLNVYGAFSLNDNRIEELSDAMREYNDRMLAQAEANNNVKPVLLYQDGRPLNAVWAVPSLGIDPMSGKEIFINSEGKTTTTYSSNDLVCYGSGAPKYEGNFGFVAEYKGFGINATFRYLGGGVMYNSTLVDRVENVDLNYNVDRRVFTGRWQKEGDLVPYLTIRDLTSSAAVLTRPTSRFVFDRRELSMPSLSVYYDFNRDFVRKLKLERLRVSFYMNDVFTTSSIKIEKGLSYPFARSFSLNISTTF